VTLVWLTCIPRTVQCRTGLGRLHPNFTLTTLFVSNFIGVVFARTLHYQFYCWYFFSLPYLLWNTSLPTLVKFGVMVAIEVAFNVYPATPWSSLLLQVISPHETRYM